MKFVVTNDQVIHLFANHAQPRANNSQGNLSYESMTVWLGKTRTRPARVMVLRSYHTAIAFYRVENPSVIFVTDATYSVTTSAHVSRIYSAARHKEVVHVPGADYGDDGHGWIKFLLCKREMRARLVEKFAKRHLEITSAKRPRPAQAQRMAWELDRNAKGFRALHGEPLGIVLDSGLAEQAKKQIAKDERVRKATERRRAALALLERNERAMRVAEALPLWRAGELNHFPYAYDANLPTFLRVKGGDTVQTSRGAEVPLTLAIAFYERLVRGEMKEGQHVGAFQFSGEQNGEVVIGCHRIARDEMEDLYRRYAPARSMVSMVQEQHAHDCALPDAS